MPELLPGVKSTCQHSVLLSLGTFLSRYDIA